MGKRKPKKRGVIYFSPGPEASFEAHAIFSDYYMARFKLMSKMKDESPDMTWDEIEQKLIDGGRISILI